MKKAKVIDADVVIKYLTAGAIIFSFLQVVNAIIYKEIPESNKELFAHLIGIIEGSFVGGLCAFYYTRSNKSEVNPDPVITPEVKADVRIVDKHKENESD